MNQTTTGLPKPSVPGRTGTFIRELTAGYRHWLILLAFFILSTILLLPLSANLRTMVPDPTDPLLNVWRMHWVKHALLSNPDGARHVFDANVFYPYPMTLAFSEHLLGETFLALPVLLVAQSPLSGMNGSVLLSFVLSAYATYLLITDWTRCRWAGLLAGLLMAFAPFRFGHIHHLELLVTQWVPLTLLSLHWLLTGRRRVAWVLLIVFFNLQALSSITYTMHLALACLVMVLAYLLLGRIRWRWGLLAGLAAFCGVTLIINLPLWNTYLNFSDLFGAVRTPGEVRVYSAAVTDYLTTIPQNHVYGWTFGRWQPPGHQFQPLMPVGLVGLLLAVIGAVCVLRSIARRDPESGLGLFFLLLIPFAFILSLGTNEEALGPGLAPLLSHLLPYGWLYEHVPGFKGVRVPARYAMLVMMGLVGLAGWGLAGLVRFLKPGTAEVFKPGGDTASHAPRHWLAVAVPLLLGLLVVVEYWSVPLSGPRVAYGQQIPPVYTWLRNTQSDAVVLELPYVGTSEFEYEYFSTYHWRRLVNGGSGYTPPAHKQLRELFKTFPDWRSIDVLQQLGVDYVVLHQPQTQPEAWAEIRAQLPGYAFSLEEIHQVGESVVLKIARPECRVDPAQVVAELSPAGGDSQAVTLSLFNFNSTTLVNDVTLTSWLDPGNGGTQDFLEPLLILPGQASEVSIPLDDVPLESGRVTAHLASLNRQVSLGDSHDDRVMSSAGEDFEQVEQPLDLTFQDGATLSAAAVLPSQAYVCQELYARLRWGSGVPNDTAIVQLVDRFDRVVTESRSSPWQGGEKAPVDIHRLPLPATLPPGGYGLRLLVRTADGRDRAFVSQDGTVIPAGHIPLLPVVLHPNPTSSEHLDGTLAAFASPETETVLVELAGVEVSNQQTPAGDWLRFTLWWRVKEPFERDLTVFTQLIGPDGRVWGQQDNPPWGGWYPFPLWSRDEMARDDYAFQVDPTAPPGTYSLVAGLYDTRTLERLRVTGSGGGSADHVVLASINVSPAP